MGASVVIIGGGPAGAAAGRLLASWGHRVLILRKPANRLRGLAESLPPSTLKLFAQIGVLDLVQHAGFYRSTGNTVWWGARERRVESFQSGGAHGFQVFRPELDRLLLDSAVAVGAEVRTNATVRAVHCEAQEARVEFESGGARQTASCRFVLDCSGRAGVIGRRFRSPGIRMYALVGAWHALGRAELPDETHTLVESFDTGWAWSVPISQSTRHVGVMVEGVSPYLTPNGPASPGRALAGAYCAGIARTTAHARLVNGATLESVWACDASTYTSETCGGPQFLLVGDAGSFIDPLSSFGVKKALASAWIAALAVNTSVTHPERQPTALDFFSEWERGVCAAYARRSRDFAREACAAHPSSFWTVRANATVADAGSDVTEHPTKEAIALQMLKASVELDLTMADGTRFEKRPVIRGREIVLEDAFADGNRGIRFRENVDLVRLAEMACRHRHVPDLFEAYCRTNGPASLHSVLGGLSHLLAKGILNGRNMSRC